MKISYFIFFLFVLLSCKTKVKPESNKEESLSGSIKKVQIEQRIEDFNPHFTDGDLTIYFYIEVINNTSNTISLHELFADNLDELYYYADMRPTFKFEMDSIYNKVLTFADYPYNNVGLIAFEASNKNTKIPPFSSVLLRCRLLSNIYGRTLNQTFHFYKDFLNSSFKVNSISFNKDHKTIQFKKSSDYEILLMQDGIIINKNDSIRMNKKNPKLLDKLLDNVSNDF